MSGAGVGCTGLPGPGLLGTLPDDGVSIGGVGTGIRMGGAGVTGAAASAGGGGVSVAVAVSGGADVGADCGGATCTLG